MQKIKIEIPDLVRRVLISWILAVSVEWFLLPGALRSLAALDGLKHMSLVRVIVITCAGTVCLQTASAWLDVRKAERWSLVCVFSVLAFWALRANFSWAFLGICALLEIGLIVFGIWGWNGQPEPEIQQGKTHKAWLWITVGLCAAFFLLVSAWTVSKVYSFCCPTFDFGIFSQMFYNMTKSGLPMTTVERDGLLSHFAVHVSPIYYWMLPFYWLIPKPATLQVLQAAVITSSVIPLWKIGKHHGLSGMQRTLACGMLLLYPAFSGGTSYDIHENCFLTPLILWLFYGIDRRNGIVTALAAFLVLTVKEDAAVYVAVIALWLLVKAVLRGRQANRWDLLAGFILLAGSLVWFSLVTGYLTKNGDGVMTYRYQNFMYDGSSSLFAVIKAVIMNPMKAVYECVDPEKLHFLTFTMVPLLGLPFLTRRYERYILWIPYILVNLMSDYRYQHDIFFQYTFGSTACLMYLTVVNLADFKIDRIRSAALLGAVLVGAVYFGKTIVPIAVRYPVQAKQYYDYYQTTRDALSQIPEDASVTAHTFYTTELSQREVLYDIRYTTQEHLLESEYVVLNPSSKGDFAKYASYGKDNGLENVLKLLQEHHYELIFEQENRLLIFKKSQ